MVSVVVPHYGDPAPTLALVEQLRAQRDADLDVVVVDDASPEPMPQVEAVPGRPHVTVVRRESNGGFGAAVNTGAALATHDLLLVLNSDLTIGDTLVRDLVAAAAPWQPCVAGPLVVRADGRPEHNGRHFPTVGHQAVEWLTPLARWRPRLHEQVGHDTRCVAGAHRPVDWLVGAALLIPTTAFRDAGGFDERYFMNAEEVDLQRRLRERGVPSVFLGSVSVTHVGGGSSDPARRRAWVVQARMTYAAKWGGERRLRAALAAARRRRPSGRPRPKAPGARG